jgi:hypothetical protein
MGNGKKSFNGMAFVVMLAVGLGLAAVVVGILSPSPKSCEVVEDNHFTMREFLAERSIVMDTTSPRAKKVYPFVLVTDRPTESRSQDALWIAERGKKYFVFTNDGKTASCR